MISIMEFVQNAERLIICILGENDAHGRLHEMYDDKNAHSDYAKRTVS